MNDTLSALAAEAYVYGFPLLSDLHAVNRSAGGFNTFAHKRGLSVPGDRVNCANNDALHSTAQLDMSGGPLWLHVPDTGGRYYVLQFVDAWTDNFAYLGRRSTGTAARDFLLVPPGWAGREAPGAHIIRVPTMVATIVGRFECRGAGDVAAVRGLQDALTLDPMYPQVPLEGLPQPQAGVADELVFFEWLRRSMAAFPPSPAERRHQRRFGPIGLLERGPSPYADPGHELLAALRDGMSTAREELEEAATTPTGGPVDGWTNELHAFDYNLDYFEVGALDSPQWKVADRDTAHRLRAVAARTGLWGNHAYEATYPTVHKDAAGERLTGARDYTLTLDPMPPVDAFWSVTMYEAPQSLLVDNEIDRYSVGSHTKGLRPEADGSLRIVISHRRPDDVDDDANWLPAPRGEFRPVLRMYQPGRQVLDGGYRPPPVVPAPR